MPRNHRPVEMPVLSEYETVDSLVEKSDGRLGLYQLRNILARREELGLSPAVSRIGKRLYIHRAMFEQWVRQQGSRGPQAGRA